MRQILSCLLLLALAACSTTGTISYLAPPVLQPGPRGSVSSVSVIDRRNEKPNRVATIRGEYGNPLAVLDTPTPVSDQVAIAFTKALELRGMLAAAAPYRFQVTLGNLSGDQFLGRRAQIEMHLAVLDKANRTVYADGITDSTSEFKIFENVAFQRIEDLQAVVERLLSTNIDRLLDKPGLHNALAGAPAAGPRRRTISAASPAAPPAG